jgi:hypothetical protein
LSDEQQLFPQLFPEPQHAAAVLSFMQPSLQQEVAVLSALSFMHDIASLPPQQDASLPVQQDSAFASVLFFACRVQLAPSFMPLILSQQELFAFSAGAVFACGGAGVWVAVWAHEATVRAKTNANILCFIIRLSLKFRNWFSGSRSVAAD